MNEKKESEIKNKGITLVALVITIIVLIILAGASINLLFDSGSGLIAKAKIGANHYKEAEQNEQERITAYENKIENETTVQKEEPSDVIIYTDTEGKKTEVPLQATVSAVAGETTVAEGLVITMPDGSEFVWVPVPIPVLDVQGMNDTQINTAIQAEVTAGRYPMAIKVNSTDYNGVMYDMAGTSSVMATPRAYSTLGTDNKEPFYLTNSSNGDASASNTVGVTRILLQNEYNAMVNSVIARGGFYIGRYETSIRTGSIVQSKANVIPMRNLNWWGMYDRQKKYAADNTIAGITSNMIYGSQWDQVMLWMRVVPNPGKSKPFYVLDSTEMGWYINNSGNTVKNTGTRAAAKVKNIYDMAGNIWDWTQSGNGTGQRIIRGRTL